MRWDTAGLEELLVWENVAKGSGDGGESNEGLQVVPAQSHSLSLLCLVSVLHLHKEHQTRPCLLVCRFVVWGLI